MFDRYTARTQRIMALARDQAGHWGHDYIGAEHMLLGLLMEASGIATAVLEEAGHDIEELRKAVTSRLVHGTGDGTLGQIPFTPRAKSCLELSLREAHELGHTHIGSEHLLLGLCHLDGGIVGDSIAERGISLEAVRKGVIAHVQPSAEAREAEAAPETEAALLQRKLDQLERLVQSQQEEIARLREQLA
jgi:ATP-dependent Clp protease ATP-binding subunit ClpC